jgi:tetratricopeptide (TPR) repeat protein
MALMRRPLWPIFALAAAACAANTGVVAQVLPGEIERGQLDSELRRYRDLISDYRGGSDASVDRLLKWDAKAIRRVFPAIESVIDETRPWGLPRFKAAVMLHTDAALALLARVDADAALFHLDAASQLLQKAGAEGRPYVGRWYRAGARLLQQRESSAAAVAFLTTGRGRFPSDPVILFEGGILHELMAGDTTLPNIVHLPNLSAPSREPKGATDSSARLTGEDVGELKRRRMKALGDAAEWLRASLELDDANELAHLHLGRVESLRDRQDEALALLGRVAGSSDPAVAYLAHLFTGAVHQRRGQLARSAAAYRAAIERFPRSHAAHIALSAVLRTTGQIDESRELVRGVVDGTPASRRDPWWSYLREPTSLNTGRLVDLRTEARR